MLVDSFSLVSDAVGQTFDQKMRVGVCEQMHCHLHADVIYIFGIVSLQHWMIAAIRDSNKCENLVSRIRCLRILPEHKKAEKRHSGKSQILLNMSLFHVEIQCELQM